jgi:hypothetical protein
MDKLINEAAAEEECISERIGRIVGEPFPKEDMQRDDFREEISTQIAKAEPDERMHELWTQYIMVLVVINGLLTRAY